MKVLVIASIILSVQYICLSQRNICPNRRKVCQPSQLCVTWDRACSIGAHCIPSSVQNQPTYECIYQQRKPIVPLTHLCEKDEVWARGVQKLCKNEPCPLWWGYTCYAKTHKIETCENSKLKCGFGKHCVMGEICNEHFCEPKPTCQGM